MTYDANHTDVSWLYSSNSPIRLLGFCISLTHLCCAADIKIHQPIAIEVPILNMSRIQQDWLLPLIEQDDDFREHFYNDDKSLEPDYNPLPTTIHFGEYKMKKIYQFDCTNGISITIDQFQLDPNQVIIKVHNNDNVMLLQFDKDEFHDLCGMRFNIDYPILPAKPELSLVA